MENRSSGFTHFMKLALLGLLLSVQILIPKAAAAERRYRLTLQFSEPDCKMSWVLSYGEDFHLFLDDCPIAKNSPFPAVPFVAGSLYSKKGATYFSLGVSSTALDKSDNGQTFSGVKHLKLPASRVVELPPAPGAYRACRAIITFLP